MSIIGARTLVPAKGLGSVHVPSDARALSGRAVARRPGSVRYALPISVGAALLSAAAAGFAAGYEIVAVSGARRKATAHPAPPRH